MARIESKTVIVTREQRDTVPIPKSGLSQLGRWMSEEDFEKAFSARFPGCMKGEQAFARQVKVTAASPCYVYPDGHCDGNGHPASVSPTACVARTPSCPTEFYLCGLHAAWRSPVVA